MNTAQKWKIGLLSAMLPTIIAALLAAVIVIVYRFVAQMGPNEIERKAQQYAQLAKYAPKNATVFFGDSITELCRIDDIYGEYSEKTGVAVVNRGISAETTTSMLRRIEESVISIRPKNLVMLMGVNDLNHGAKKEEITENIRQMIRLVKEKTPETNIILQGVYPTDPNRASFYERMQLKGRDNAAIRELNEMLAGMAEEERIRFVNVTDALADENGNLRKDYTFDGLHPNVSGYLAVREFIIAELL